jgi:serine/threonine protein kinase
VSAVTSCLADDTVLAFAQGQISPDELSPVEAHLHVCADCRSVVAETAKFLHQGEDDTGASGDPAHDRPSQPLMRGTEVARYLVTDVMGVGAAGVVYRAYDPQLRRKIALKLLRPEHSQRSHGAQLEARLLREARAMARLSHPNVVTVFDVGMFKGQIFIVMELVEGETLAEWLSRPQSLQARLALFVEAGRGLSAAHAEQIAHRDFKPANVLVGLDGRVRVTDFGLARPWLDQEEGELAAEITQVSRLLAELNVAPRHALSSATMGTEGELAGTPAFMAPEQFLRREIDARADQFSFCVALYTALYGMAPFVGRTLSDLANAVISGQLCEPPDTSDVPKALFGVLKRGLSADPDARYPHMNALLEELSATSYARPAPPSGLRLSSLSTVAAGTLLIALGGWYAQHSPVAAKRTAPLLVSAHPIAQAAEPLAAQMPAGVLESLPSGARVAESARVPGVKEPLRVARAPSRTPAPRAQRSHAALTRSEKRRPDHRAPQKAGKRTLAPTSDRYEDRLKDPFQ